MSSIMPSGTADNKSFTDSLVRLQQWLSGGGSATAQNSVYLGGNAGTRQVQMKRTGEFVNVPTEDISTIQQANALYLTDEKLRAKWRKTMQKNGLETGNPLVERRAWETAVAGASDWYVTSNGTAKVTPEQYLNWWAGGSKKKAEVPTRQVYNITPEQIDTDINEIALKTLGRTVTDADRDAEWYQDLVKGVQKLYAQGVVSEPAKMVKNKKTGKMERVVTQTPEFSKEQVTQRITEAVEAADPESLERKKRLDFTGWLYGQMGQG